MKRAAAGGRLDPADLLSESASFRNENCIPASPTAVIMNL